MMDSLRKTGAKVLTVLLFGLLILSFAVWGIGDMFSGPGVNTAVIEVDGVRVDQREFSTTLRRSVRRLEQAFGQPIDMEQARAFGLVDQVIGEMSGRALLERQAQAMGLVVSRGQLAEAIRSEPAFQDATGTFDQMMFERALQVSGLSEQGLLAQLSREANQEQIAGAVTEGAAAPEILADALYRFQSEQRVAEYVLIPRSGIEAPADPDEETLQSFYGENTQRFMAPEYRALTFLHLAVADFAGEVGISEDRLRETFEERREEFVVPERRRIEQIVLADEAAAKAAKARVDEGADFAAVAQESTGNPPVDLGLLSAEEFLPELTDAVFALPQNKVSDPLASPLGWHLVRATEIRPREEPTFEGVRERLRSELAEAEAVEALILTANQLDDELGGGASLETAADALGLRVETVPAVDARGQDRAGNSVEGLPGGPDFLRSAFALGVGEESLLVETAEGGQYVVRVDEIVPTAPKPFEEVREDVLEAWRRAEVERMLEERAEAFAARLSEAGGFQGLTVPGGAAAAKTQPLRRDDGAAPGSPSPQLAARLFEVDQGEVVRVPGPDGQVVAQLVEIRPADPGADRQAVEALRGQLDQAIAEDLLAQFSNGLRSRFDLTVNRQLVDQLTNDF